MSNKTSLGEENEKAILAELAPIIDRWAKKLREKPEHVKSSIAYLWADQKRESDQSYRDWLSANEIGPFGGR